MTPSLLVTGAQGFVGRWFVAEALRRWPERRVVGIGRSAPASTFTHEVTLGPHRVRAPLPDELRRSGERFVYRALDVRDEDALAALFDAERPELVVHLASALRDDPPSALFPINVEGTIALLRTLARARSKPRAIVVVSSGSVYGASAPLPAAEGDPCSPTDLYGVSKLAAEMAAALVAREADLPVIVARAFNIVGPGLDERHACARFASQFAAIAAGLAPPRLSIGNLSPTRDFIDVRDTATGLALLLDRGVPGTTYNVASGEESSIRTVFSMLARRANVEDRIEVAQTYGRAGDYSRSRADIGRMRSLGFAPAHPLDDALSRLYDYYIETVARASPAAAAASGTQG